MWQLGVMWVAAKGDVCGSKVLRMWQLVLTCVAARGDGCGS